MYDDITWSKTGTGMSNHFSLPVSTRLKKHVEGGERETTQSIVGLACFIASCTAL